MESPTCDKPVRKENITNEKPTTNNEGFGSATYLCTTQAERVIYAYHMIRSVCIMVAPSCVELNPQDDYLLCSLISTNVP
jgi:hypothetical protein